LLMRHQQMGAAQETGAGILSLDLAASTLQQTDIGLGLRFETQPIVLDDSDLTLMLDASYTRVLGDTANSTTTLLGRSITATGADLDPNVFRVSGQFNLDSATGTGPSWFGRYGAQVQGSTVSHSANFGMTLSF
jgi:hypothetical protein